MAWLVRGGWVVVDDGEGHRVLDDGAVLVEGDTIAAVGTWDTLRAEHREADVLGGPDCAVLSGLINAHHHANAITHIQHGVMDDVLEPWLLGNTTLRPTDGHDRTLFAAARLLKTGVTAVVDMASVPAVDAAARDGFSSRLRAYESAGVRGVLCPGVSFLSRLVHNEDAAFLASLPAELAARAKREIVDRPTGTPDDYLAMMTDLIGEAADLRFARIGYGPPGPQWVGDDLMVRIAEAAETHDTVIQTHVQESLYEKQEGPRRHGRSTIAHLDHLGVMSDRLSLAHAVWASEADIELLARSGTAVSHNPSSNLRLRSGIAPMAAMREAGVTVGLGMDGTTLNDDEDYFGEMRLALRLQRTPEIARSVPTPRDVLGLATTGGARLMRRADIGRIATGLKADLAVVDMARASWPWRAPEADGIDFVVQRAQAGDVAHVLVDGEVMLRDGQPTRVDMAAVGDRLAAQLAEEPFAKNRAALASALKPHLEAWYADWDIGSLSPYAAMNSKS